MQINNVEGDWPPTLLLQTMALFCGDGEVFSWKLSKPLFFKKLEFTPCKAEQPLQGMELQEKEAQKD